MNGLKLILTAVLIAINSFFVVAEYALVRSRRARLELMREEGTKGASLALDQLGNINEYISSVQIGVTLTSIGIGALGEPALAAILKSALGGTLSHGVAVAISVVLAFTIISLLFGGLLGTLGGAIGAWRFWNGTGTGLTVAASAEETGH